MENKSQALPNQFPATQQSVDSNGTSTALGISSPEYKPQAPNLTPDSRYYPIENLESPSPSTLDQASQMPVVSSSQFPSQFTGEDPQKLKQKKQRTRVIITIVTVALILVSLLGWLFIRRNQQEQQRVVQEIPEQNVELTGIDNGLAGLSVDASSSQVLVNGNIVSSGSMYLLDSSTDFFGQISIDNLTANNSYVLPDSSGTVCLDSNNCDFLTNTQLNGAVAELEAGVGITINNETISINQTVVTNDTGFIQGGNSFGEAAVLGANDSYSLSFETGGTTRMTIGTDGHVGLNEAPISEAGLYSIQYITDDANCFLGCFGALSVAGVTSQPTSASSVAAIGAVLGIGAPGITFSSGAGVHVLASTLVGGSTITSNYGILVADQTAGTNDYGISIQGADTQALWIGSGADNTDAANGIAFGLSLDTNLYRSAANTLRTDDLFSTGGSVSLVTEDQAIDSFVSFEDQLSVGSGATLTVSNDGMMRGIVFNPTIIYDDPFVLTGGRSIEESPILTNPTGVAKTMPHQTGFYASATIQGDGALFTTSRTAFLDPGNYTTINGGSVSATFHIGFGSDMAVGAGATVLDRRGVDIIDATGAGSVTDQYGIYVRPLTKGTNDYGIRVDAADTQTLWISGNADNTTAAAGIAFGSSRDTNLYRSAADTLKTDDRFLVNRSNYTNNAFSASVTGDANVRLNIDASGLIKWGDGTNPYDTTLYRGAADTLKTDDNLVVASTAPDASGGASLFIDGILSSTTWNQYGLNSAVTISPGSASALTYTGILGQTTSSSSNLTAAQLIGVYGSNRYSGTGTVGATNGLYAGLNNVSTGTVAINRGLYVSNPFNTGGGTITSNYGIVVADQTAGTSDYGIIVGGADTQVLWLSSGADNTDAANGIAFGSSRDTNLYRSAADTLRTDDNFAIGGTALTLGATASTNGKIRMANTNTIGWRNAADDDNIIVGVNASDIFTVASTVADAATVAQFTNDGATTCTVQPGGTGFACSSDERLKTNVTTIGNSMDVIDALRGVGFNWISNPNGDMQFGFLAQELEQIIPSAVSEDSNGYKVANYEAIVPFLVGGVQELSDKVDNLEAQLANINQSSGTGIGTDISVENLTVTTAATFEGVLSVTGDATFAGDIIVEGDLRLAGKILGNDSTRGKVTIQQGETEVEYVFDKPFTAKPNVILTATNAFAPSYRVEATNSKFTLYLKDPAAQDTIFNYQAQQ